MKKTSTIEAKERWEKAFEKKMTHDECIMFCWGYVYAIDDLTK